jgi:hypothetical protein
MAAQLPGPVNGVNGRRSSGGTRPRYVGCHPWQGYGHIGHTTPKSLGEIRNRLHRLSEAFTTHPPDKNL